MGRWLRVLAMVAVFAFPGSRTRAQYALTGRVLGAGAVTSTSGGYKLVGGLGPGASGKLSGDSYGLRGSVVPRALVFTEKDADPETPDPDHWWKLDGDLRDAITGESARAVNGQFFVPGRINQAFDFRGTNHLELGTTQGNFGAQDFTLMFWMTGESRVVSPTVLSWRSTCGALPHWRLRLTAQNFAAAQPGFSFYGQDPTSGTIQLELAARPRGSELTVKDGRWHQVAVVRNGTNLVVYRDGLPILAGSSRQIATLPSEGVLIAGLDPCSIGKPWSNDPRLFDNPLLGQIDEIKIYRRALTPTMIVNEWKRTRLFPISSSSPSRIEFVSEGASPAVFRWLIDLPPGQDVQPEELTGVQLEASPDLEHWSPLPNFVRLATGRIELMDAEAFLKSACFYRLVFR